jgi:DNA-binding CsgD family transcriptional regulator
MSAMLERDGETRDEFEHARETLDANGQKPLRAMVDFDEARWCQERKTPDLSAAERLAQLARDQFESLQRDYWTSRASELLSTIHERAGPPTYPAGLTDREVDVLRLVVLGQSDKEISDSLFISPRTVNAHMRNMFGKTGAANRTDLSVWALAQGLVTRPTSDSVTR